MRRGFSFKEKWPRVLIQDGWGLSVCFVLLSSLVLVVIWGITMMHVASEKKLAMESASSESRNMAVIMAANLNDRLSRSGQYAAVGSKVLDGDTAAADYLGFLFNGDSAYVRAAVFDEQMRLRYSSAGLPEESDFAQLLERAYPQTAVTTDAPKAGTTLFGKTDSHNWRMPMLIALQAPKNGTRGYLVAVLDLGRFLHDYQQIRDGYRVAVNGAAGTPLVALNDRRLLVGGSNDNAASTSSVSSLQKLTAYPLSVSVTINPDSTVSGLMQSHYEYVRYAIVISIAVVMLTLVLIGISCHRKKLYERLARSEREKIGLIEQLEKEKTRAYQLASHDYLTGIPNRMLFSELAAAELSRAKRSSNLYALFFIDLDGFKPINDTLGHAVGDLLLQAVAQRLCAGLREYDLVARLGGDEFVVLLSDMKYQSQIADVADKLIKTVGAPYLNLGGHEVGTSLSIGIALYPDDGHTVDELLSKADAAMYAVKNAGKGAYRFYDSAVHSGVPGRLSAADTRYLSV